MRTLILVSIFVSLSFYFFHTEAAQGPVRVKVEQVGKKPKEKTQTVTPIGVRDNQDGTSTLVLDACGTTLTFTYSNNDAAERSEEILKVIGERAERACQ